MEDAMQDVKIVKLGTIRVASVLGFGTQPEDIAWKKLNDWAGPKGLLGDLESHPIYGFNNPNPSADRPDYGYELWIVVGPEIESGGEVTVKEFEGGLYAVGRHYWTDDPNQDIPQSWMALNGWLEQSGHKMASHQWLEKSFEDSTGKGLELFLPIEG